MAGRVYAISVLSGADTRRKPTMCVVPSVWGGNPRHAVRRAEAMRPPAVPPKGWTLHENCVSRDKGHYGLQPTVHNV